MNDMPQATASLESETDKSLNQMRDVADQAIDEGRSAWNDMRDCAKDSLEGTRQKTREALEDATDWVRENPLKTVGLTLVAGALIGTWVSRQLAND